MKRLSDQVIHFLQAQGYVIVSTIDSAGFPHTACKGLVKVDRKGKVYLLDVYHGKTFANLRRSGYVSISAVDEHRFSGYCLKGKAKALESDKMPKELIKAWEERITSRLTQRLLKNIREEKGHLRHPEALLPEPKYIIEMDIEEVVDLTPQHLK
jgi:general stress protein 26